MQEGSRSKDWPTQSARAGWVFRFFPGGLEPVATGSEGEPWDSRGCMPITPFRLRKHAEYQRVYKASRKQFAKQMSYFFTVRTAEEIERDADGATGARVGLTVGKVMGKAVDRNRIKRRMREVVRRNLGVLSTPVDVILHPRRSVIDLEFAALDREVGQVFRAIQKMAARPAASPLPKPPSNAAEGD
jgi:ribonuclease P protein component